MKCAWKESFGFDCLMCGFQRSFHYLIHGDILASIKMYPPLIPFLVVTIFTLLHLIFKFKNGHRIILISFSIAVALMILNFCFKWYHGTIFH